MVPSSALLQPEDSLHALLWFVLFCSVCFVWVPHVALLISDVWSQKGPEEEAQLDWTEAEVPGPSSPRLISVLSEMLFLCAPELGCTEKNVLHVQEMHKIPFLHSH